MSNELFTISASQDGIVTHSECLHPQVTSSWKRIILRDALARFTLMCTRWDVEFLELLNDEEIAQLRRKLEARKP